MVKAVDPVLSVIQGAGPVVFLAQGAGSMVSLVQGAAPVVDGTVPVLQAHSSWLHHVVPVLQRDGSKISVV